MDPYWMWHPTRKGVSVALRSWGASKGVDFCDVKELNQHLIGMPYRTNSRRWLAWLQSAYPLTPQSLIGRITYEGGFGIE